MSLFTQVKSRALIYAVIASIAVSTLSLYVKLKKSEGREYRSGISSDIGIKRR